MLIAGTTFSFVVHGRVEIRALNQSQMVVSFDQGSGSLNVDRQKVEVVPPVSEVQ